MPPVKPKTKKNANNQGSAKNVCHHNPSGSGLEGVPPERTRRGSFEEEGVLYTVRVAQRPPKSKQSKWGKVKSQLAPQDPQQSKWNNLLHLVSHDPKPTAASGNINSSKSDPEEGNGNSNGKYSEHNDAPQALPRLPRKTDRHTRLSRSLVGELVVTPSTRKLILDDNLEDDDGEDTNGASTKDVDDVMVQRQFTISKKKKRPYGILTVPIHFISNLFGFHLGGVDVDRHRYKPSKYLSKYICWTFYSSFLAVFVSFLAIFLVLCILFAGFLLLAGNRAPECITVSGKDFGSNPETRFNDAFALSWTTFTTVGYGHTYPAVGSEFSIGEHTDECSAVVFLCTLEAFVGLLYAGMCAAILFGKVNRVQCHANVKFCNAVCLLYEHEGSGYTLTINDCFDSNHEISPIHEEDEDRINFTGVSMMPSFHGGIKEEKSVSCPVLKFQVINEYCNKQGGEIVDAFMKVVGLKMTRHNGKITHSQYVRVNLIDSEHPFFSRVWHGVHVLDSTSPLLIPSARKKIRDNGEVWPRDWFNDPKKIREKLDFHSLIVTISGTSNLSACTVHTYKRYSFGDLLIGFDFAPLVYFNEEKDGLEVDLTVIHDVREQDYGTGEDVIKRAGNRTSTLLTESMLRAQSI